MQKLISQIPQLTHYLSKLPKNQHRQTIKNIIRLGLEASRSQCCKQNSQKSSNVLRNQINMIKENIRELNSVFRQQSHHSCRCCQKENRMDSQHVFQTQPMNIDNRIMTEHNNGTFRVQNKNGQKPVRDGAQVGMINFTKNQQTNSFLKNKGPLTRHHLDDTEAREALTFPEEILVQNEVRVKRKSQSFRKHIYQQQIDKDELEKIKEQRGEKLKRDRRVSDYSKANSKIKSLTEKDRLRHTQKQRDYQFKEGFNKYEYTDENEMQQDSSLHQQIAKNYQARLQQPNSVQDNTYDPHFQSSFKRSNQASSNQASSNQASSNQASSNQKSNNKTSSKKQFSRSKNEISSKLQASASELKQQYSKQSGGSQKHFKNNKSMQIHNKQQSEEQEDDVISNSSSFSQFSMEGSRRKQVGKISRRSHND